MRVVDTIVSREGGNSAWANVVLVGDHGESVSVRLPCPVPSGSEIGRIRLADRALKLLEGIISRETAETLIERQRASPTGRFGVNPNPADVSHGSWRADE